MRQFWMLTLFLACRLSESAANVAPVSKTDTPVFKSLADPGPCKTPQPMTELWRGGKKTLWVGIAWNLFGGDGGFSGNGGIGFLLDGEESDDIIAEAHGSL